MVAPYSGQLRYVWDPAAGAYMDLYTGQYVGTAIPADAGGATYGDDPAYAPVGEYAPGSTQAPERPGYLDTLAPTGIDGSLPPDYGYITHWNPSSGPQGQGAYELNPVNPETGVPYTGVGAYEQGIDLLQPIYPDGSYVSGNPPASNAQPAAGTGTGGSGGSGGGRGSGGGGGYSNNRGGGGSSGGGYDNPFMRGRDPMDNIPNYGNGQRHPAAGGDPLVPGGRWNDGGYSRPGEARVTGGGSTNRFYRPPTGKRYRKNTTGMPYGFGWEPSPGQERAWAMRSSIMDRFVNPALAGAMGMGGGTSTDGTTTGGGGGTGGGQQTTADGAMRPARGWAGRQGFTPAKLEDIYYNPQYLYPHILPGLSTGSNFFGQLDDSLSPNLQSLWSATAGSRKKAGTGPDHYANWINRVVKNYSTPGGQFFDTNSLIRGLTNPQRGSIQWKAQQGTPFGEQAYNLTNQIGAVANTTMNPMAATATMAYLDTLLNRAGSQNLTRGPKKQINPNKYVGRNLFR